MCHRTAALCCQLMASPYCLLHLPAYIHMYACFTALTVPHNFLITSRYHLSCNKLYVPCRWCASQPPPPSSTFSPPPPKHTLDMSFLASFSPQHLTPPLPRFHSPSPPPSLSQATSRLIRSLVGVRKTAPTPSEVVQPASACRDVYRLLHENIQQIRGSFKHSPLSAEVSTTQTSQCHVRWTCGYTHSVCLSILVCSGML